MVCYLYLIYGPQPLLDIRNMINRREEPDQEVSFG